MAHACERVLVVEDDPDVRASIVDFLETEGIAPVQAASGEEALEALRRGPLPDVVLLDLGMPGMSGPELLQRIQEQPEWAEIPVAVMSGFARDRFVFAPPADEYLEKPFDVDRLNEVLSRLCRKARTGTE